ncbi:MAG: outer membrane protein assembly factor BamC [Proteobacteria bacterium]|nr:outer membrane protein assembly factor BamC [Pseudomonadota bacterium]
MYKLYALLALFIFQASAIAATDVAVDKEGASRSMTVAPAVNGVTLQSEGSLYWLQFDADADTLWPMLRDFWANEGIGLNQEEPQLGFIETDWSKDLVVEKYLSIILSDQAPTRRERFRLRVERSPEGKGTKVFINHSAYGILFDEEAVYSGYLPASPELELEMLSRLALYSGAGKGQVQQAVSSFASTSMEAERIDDLHYEIKIPGSMDFVRKNLIKALDRMNMTVSSQGEAISAQMAGAEIVNDVDENAGWDIDDNSDLEEEAFADFQSKKTADTISTYLLELKAKGSSVIIGITNHADNMEKAGGLNKFSKALARTLREK